MQISSIERVSGIVSYRRNYGGIDPALVERRGGWAGFNHAKCKQDEESGGWGVGGGGRWGGGGGGGK